MELLEQLQDSIKKLNNEETTYAILVKTNIYEMLMTTQELWHQKTFFSPIPVTSYYGIIVEIDNSIDKDFKTLTKKEYEEWENERCKI